MNQHSAQSPAPRLRKPLYLDAAGVRQLDVEGPALLARMHEGPDRYFPLARLSRLMIRGPLDVRGEALLAILKAGLSIVWLDGKGALAGHVLSSHVREDALLNQRLEDLAETGELLHVLENWRLSMQRQLILRHAAPHLGWLKDLRARTIRSRASAHILRRIGVKWDKEQQAFRPLLLALALQEWQQLGVGAQWLDPGPERPDLAALIAQLLEWPLWHIGLKLRRAPELGSWRARVAFIERHHQQLRQVAQELIDDLVHHLMSSLPGLALQEQ